MRLIVIPPTPTNGWQAIPIPDVAAPILVEDRIPAVRPIGRIAMLLAAAEDDGSGAPPSSAPATAPPPKDPK